MNWYVYCYNNPLCLRDPSGLDPFDHFATRDEAAADFGIYIGQKSIEIEEEYFSFIYEGINADGTKYYYYNIPGNDYTTHANRMTGFQFNQFDKNAIAIAHSHGAYNADTKNTKDGFSFPGNSLDPNFSDTSESDRFGVDYYVVTPEGNLYRYDANSGNYGGTLIRSNMPVDSRIKIHNDLVNTGVMNKLLSYNSQQITEQELVNVVRKLAQAFGAAIIEGVTFTE